MNKVILTLRSRFPSVGPAVLLLLCVMGCQSEVESGVESDDAAALVDSTTGSSTPLELQIVEVGPYRQRAGDPLIGKQQLLNGDYVGCGLPRRVFDLLKLDEAGPSLPGRLGRSAELPFYNSQVIDKHGSDVVSNNCLTCHATELDGQVVIGLGNEFLDFTENASRAVEAAGLLVSGEAETKSWQTFADRMSAIAPYTMSKTVGANVANNLTFALMSHFDPETLTWSSEPLIEPPDRDPLPVSVPPWWRMKKKHSMFYQGQWRGDHARIMITAAMLCAESVDDMVHADSYAADIRAYIDTIEPPIYPYSVDPVKAQIGEALFEQNCSHCHGKYGGDNHYPNRLIPLEMVGTDPELAVQTAVDYQRYNDWFRRSWFSTQAEVVPFRGYSAPPLDGVWATAPFLHNGSVPTIALLLESDQRPSLWKKPQTREYDENNLGWTFSEIDRDAFDQLPIEERKWVYDTQERGYGNMGHKFGDHLTNEERQAIIEYLKTI